MKILLVSPPQAKGNILWTYSGLGYLASCLEQAGHKIRIIDSLALNYNFKDLKREIKNFNPDVVGITATTPRIYNVCSIARIIKNINPNCLTVLGGPHPTVLPSETLEECSSVDVVVRGEGEITFVELVDYFEKNKDFSDVRGISYQNNGKIIQNPDRPPIKDLDSLPFPAYHLLPLDKYRGQFKYHSLLFTKKNSENTGVISSSRGCPYNCNFCASRAIWGCKVRNRSPKKVVEEFKLLAEKYKIRLIDFIDDTFTIDRKRVAEICKLIKKEKMDISWYCHSRVGIFNKEIASTLKQGGCNRVFIGFESGAQVTLDFLCKDFTVEQAVDTAKIANLYDFEVIGSFVIGVPGETREMMEYTISYAKKMNLSKTVVNLLVPYPGTKIYEYVKKNNLLLTNDWSKFNLFNPVIKIVGVQAFELKWLHNKALVMFRSKYS